MRNNNQSVCRLLAARSLRSNRSRNLILTAAVAIVIAMLFGTFSFVYGKVETDYLRNVRSSGTTASTVLERPTEAQYETIQNLPYIKAAGKSVWFANAASFQCVVLDETAWTQIKRPAYTQIHGEYPQSQQQVMLSVRTLEELGISQPAIGMEVPLELSFQNGQTIQDTFTLSGYFTDYINAASGIAEGYFSQQFLSARALATQADTQLLICPDDHLSGTEVEENLYRDVATTDAQQQFTGGNSMNRQAILQITGGFDVAWVLALVILLCAGLLIYNVLQISLAHDVRQYGLLKILGTTERQLYQIFLRQMARLCLTGGGIGVALGLGLTLGLLPGLLKQMYLHQMGEITATIAFQPWILLGTTGFGIAVCMLSAIFPLQRAIHLPPVESVKFIGSASQTSRTLPRAGKKPAWETVSLAWRNITRFRKRFLLTVGSLALSLIVAMAGVILARGTDTTNRISYEVNYDFKILSHVSALDCDQFPESESWFPEDLKDRVLQLDGVTESLVLRGSYGKVSTTEPALSLFFAENPTAASQQNFVVQIVDDAYLEELAQYLQQHSLPVDLDAVIRGESMLILHDHLLSPAQQQQSQQQIGMPISIYRLNSQPCGQMQLGGYLDLRAEDLPRLEMTWNSSNILYFLVSEQGFSNLGLPERTFGLECRVDPALEPALKHTLNQMVHAYNRTFYTDSTQPWYVVQDARMVSLNAKSDQIDSEQQYILFSRIVIGAVCGMLLLLGLTNYINVTATSVLVRKKELAVLESIGMTGRQSVKMLLWEGALYGLLTIALALSFGSLLWAALGQVMQKRLAYFVFQYPLWELVLSFLLLGALCILVPLLIYARLQKESLVQRLR